MRYKEIIQRLFAVNFFSGTKMGLQNSMKLRAFLNHPDHSFHSIHVAGTNGKGSVVTKIASGLQEAGYKVGLYTSPHISCFRERIKINGQMIPEIAVLDLLANLFTFSELYSIPATFFELTTMMAFIYFQREKVDFAVLETGLGGRLDATNVVNPVLSVITSVALDHTDILGKSEDLIAIEKGGIIKPKVPVVISYRTPRLLLQSMARRCQSPFTVVPECTDGYEKENEGIARASLENLASRFYLPSTAIEKGLLATQPCRFEIFQSSPLIIFDVGHNPDGIEHFFQAFQQRFPNQSVRVVFGLSKNKEIKKCLTILQVHAKDFHIVEATNGRGIPTCELRKQLSTVVDSTHIFEHDSINDGVLDARDKAAAQGQALIICGSFFIMSEARQALGIEEIRDEFDLNERLIPHFALRAI